MYSLWDELGTFEIKEQHLACQVRRILKGKQFSDIETEQLKREIDHENGTTVKPTPIIDTVLDCRDESEIVVENSHDQNVLVEEQPVDMQQRDSIKNPVYNCLIEIVQKGATGLIPPLRSRDITLLNMYVNAVNEVVKGILVHKVTELKNIARAGALLVCEKWESEVTKTKMLRIHFGRGE